MDLQRDLRVLRERGMLQEFQDHDGVVRLRLTAAGARAIGQEELACLLEACATGKHTVGRIDCACGERRRTP